MSALLALIASPAAAIPGAIDLGGYAGVFLPSQEHELYDPTDSEFRVLAPAPTLGGRLTWRFVPFLGAEGDAALSASGVDGGGTAMLTGLGLQGIALLPDVVSDRFTPFATVGTGNLAVTGDTSVGSDIDAAFRIGIGAQLEVADQTLVRLDLRDHLSAHYDIVPRPAQNFEVLIGITRTVVGGEPRDPDGDGIVGRSEQCPDQAETKNGWNDEDGCPDQLGRVKLLVKDPAGIPLEAATIRFDGQDVGFTDAAGMAVIPDRMPGTSVSRIEVVPESDTAIDTATWTEPVAIVEGDVSRTIETRWLPGATKLVVKDPMGHKLGALVNFVGPKKLAEIDTGVDGIAYFTLDPGEWTLYTSAESYGIDRKRVSVPADDRNLRTVEVSLAPAVVQTTREEVVLLEAIQFDVDKATIKAESMPLIQQIANTLGAHPEVLKVEVQGHTDSKGSDSYNKKLSQQRVESVVNALAAEGLDKSRLVPVGYGEGCPLTPNKTEADRAVNRRVQIFILDPAPKDPVPCQKGAPARKATPTTVTVPVTVPATPAPR